MGLKKLSEHFRNISVAYLQEASSNSMPKKALSTLPGFRSLQISSTEPPSAQLLVIEMLLQSKSSHEKLKELLKEARFYEAIIFTPSFKEYRVLRLAMQQRVLDVLPLEISEQALLGPLKRAINAIAAEKRRRMDLERHKRVLASSPSHYMIMHEGRVRYRNREDGGLFDAIGQSPLFKRLETLDTNARFIHKERTPQGERSYLLDIKVDLKSSSKLISCLDITDDISLCKESSEVSRGIFLEQLKNLIAQRNATHHSSLIMMARPINTKGLKEEHDSALYLEFLREFAIFCEHKLAQELHFTFWHEDFLVFILSEKEINTQIAKIEDICKESGIRSFKGDIKPFFDIFLFDMKKQNINSAILLIEHCYGKQHDAIKEALIERFCTTSIEGGGSEQALFYIDNLRLKGRTLKLLNIYKGLSINTGSEVLSVKNSAVHLKTEKIQKYLMHMEKKVVLQSSTFPRDIEADVTYLDAETDVATITNPRFLTHSANSRKSIRVQPEVRIPINLTTPKHAYTGEMLDISLEALAIKYMSNISRNIKGERAKVGLTLPSKKAEGGLVKLEVKGVVSAIIKENDYTKAIVAIQPQSQEEGHLMEYIYRRQKEIIIEIKRQGSVAFS